MHDPMTVAWEIKYPWREKPSKMWPEGYRHTFITIWHVDPCLKGGDDSCGWFKRAHHGDPAVLEKIEKRFEFDWDRVFKSDSGKVYYTGYFMPEDDGAGMPNMGVSAIVLNLFHLAALAYFGDNGDAWKPARKFCRKHLFDILLFGENPTDSLRDSIIRKWGDDTNRKDRIHSVAACIYGWILRAEQPWYRHPRWHIHHWKLQIHPLQAFKRWAFSRCATCGKGFRWGQGCWTNSWSGTGPRWFRSEKDIHHDNCGNH